MSKYHDLKHLFSSTNERLESQARAMAKSLERAERADAVCPGAGDKYRREAARMARKMARN
jgi:hypothetical protein